MMTLTITTLSATNNLNKLGLMRLFDSEVGHVMFGQNRERLRKRKEEER